MPGLNEPAPELKSTAAPGGEVGTVNAAAGTEGRTTSGGSSLIVTRPLLERHRALQNNSSNCDFPRQLARTHRRRGLNSGIVPLSSKIRPAFDVFRSFTQR